MAKKLSIPSNGTIHLVGICGTGMGALAGLLVDAGYKVTGSDTAAYPPMSIELARRGIQVMEGYGPQNLAHRPDLVVIGNVCRVDHPEAAAARDMKLAYASLPRTVHDLFLVHKKPIVIAGTHGKTTTTALTGYLLEACGMDPSLLVGGITVDFGSGAKLGAGEYFVIEGDEYDSAYFEKFAKFLSYAPHGAVITSVEHDHIDIYPTVAEYEAAFRRLAEMVSGGPLAVYAGDQGAVNATSAAQVEVIPYAVDADPQYTEPRWIATPAADGHFVLTVDGSDLGLFQAPMPGNHNLRNTLAALIMAHRCAGVSLDDLRRALPGFGGIARRQQVIGTPNGITVYDDFAHHPTAVRETLAALRTRHPTGRLIAAFEPRSATACRRLHQDAYAQAFAAADIAMIAPVGRDLPRDEILDTAKLADDLCAGGQDGRAARSIDELLSWIITEAKPGDAVALLSNGSFGSIHQRLIEALA